MYTIFDHAHLHVNGRNILIGYVVIDGEKEKVMEFDEVECLFKEFQVYDSLQMSIIDTHSESALIQKPGRMCLQIEDSIVLWPTKLSEFTKLLPVLTKRNFNVNQLNLEKIENDKLVDLTKDTYAKINILIKDYPEYELKEGQDVLLLEKKDDFFKISVLDDFRELLVNHSVLSSL